MAQIQQMSNQELIDEAVELLKKKEQANTELELHKAELQNRGLFILDNRNNKYCKLYGNDGNQVAVSETQELDVLNFEKLKEAIGEGVIKEKVTENSKITYKFDRNLEKALKAIFMGNYTFEYTLADFLDSMSVEVDSKKKALLLKRLKGDYKADKKTLLSVLGYLTKDNTEEDAEAMAPDLDVELYYISKIKNAELIQAFLPEEEIEWSIDQVKRCVLVESKLKLELSYRKEE